MKLTIVLLIAACLQVSAKGYAQKVTLKESNIPLQKVFEEIRKQTGYQFFYADEVLATAKNVTLNVRKKSIEEVLDYCFQDQQLSFTISEHTIIVQRKEIVPEVNVPPALPPAAIVINGRITDDKGQPLEGVTILIKGTNSGTKSDANGNFSIDADPNTSLVISYVGFESTEVRVGNRSNISIQLKPIISTEEQVVVIGYGSRSKRDVTTAISTISADKIGKQVPASPELLMQGQMSGVQVIGNQGNPNARPIVRIRGTNTFGVSDPLYVVDGIPIKEWGAGVEGTSDQYTRGGINIMAMIDPNDIESISVLKDASAGAIYGVRASNGVVLITTKKGKTGKARVTYSQRFGVQNLNKKIDLLDTKGYTDFNNALYASDPTSDGSRSPLNEVFRPTNPNYLGNSSTYDWQNEVKNKNAIIQDYSVNVSGGTDKADYYLSFGYSNQDGVYILNNMKRYNGSFKLNVKINQYLRVGINYRLSTAKGRDKTGDIGSLVKTASTPVWQPIYDPQGINGYAQVVKGYDDNGVWNNNVLYGSMTRYNLPGYFSMINDYNSSLRNMGNAYVELEPIKGLKLKGTLSIDRFDNTYTGGGQYISSYFQYDGGDPNALASGSVGDYGVRSIKNYNIVSEFTANYVKSFGSHHLDFLFSAMDQKYEADWSDIGTSYVTSTNPNLINLGGDNQYTRAGGFKKLGALQGFLFRGDYNFANKYYIDATLRRDGSARFAPENRWGIFPAVSVAWRMNRENFMDNASWINDLKFRAGWGQLGNQEVSDLAYLSTINTAPTYAWGTNPNPRTNNPLTTGLGYTSSGAAVYGMANKDLQWERTTTLNVGFDATMFTNLDLSLEYYNKLTDGILQQYLLPPSTGVISMPKGNVAKVRNSGIELNLNYRHSVGDLNLSVGGNFTTVLNKVETLYGGIPMFNIEEGQSLFYIRGYKVDGIFQSDEEATAWMQKYNDLSYQSPKIRGGDFYFKDLRGAPTTTDISKGINKYYSPAPDSVIDSYDQVYLGKSIPGFYYGFNINADYKGIDFMAQFTGVGDVQKTNDIKQIFGMPYGEALNHTADVLNAWTPTNKNTNVPRMIWQDPAANGRFSDYFVENAGYLRLANIQIGYTLPKSVYTHANNILQNARIYLGCSNLFTVTSFKGLDPEDQYNPAPLIVYSGINIKF